ncbi:MAG: MBL fold metallo-hydrolase [Saprospiraceae bacterium]
MQILSDNIYMFQSGLWQLNSIHAHYIDTSIIWDPAYLPMELQKIANKVINPIWPKRYLAFTHGDYDHIAGSPYFESFVTIGSQEMQARQNKSTVLKQIEGIDQEFYIERIYPLNFPDLEICPLITNSPTVLHFGSIECHIFHAGGHTSDGLFYVLPQLGLWIAGDYLSDIEFPFVEDSIEEYLKTLNQAKHILENYDIEFMVPGHGRIACSKNEIYNRIESSHGYLEGLIKETVPDWRESWGSSPFEIFLDKMHRQNIGYVRSKRI